MPAWAASRSQSALRSLQSARSVTKAAEPVIPLHLFRSSIFTFSNIASFAVSMMMFGALIYIPVYAQGVLGVDATNSGLILMPMICADAHG